MDILLEKYVYYDVEKQYIVEIDIFYKMVKLSTIKTEIHR